MKKKSIITYLFGAGASAGCLPVVNNMGPAISECATRARVVYNALPRDKRDQLPDGMSDIERDLKWLSEICQSHSSIDTYAKKLFIRDEEKEYEKLKIALSIYFTLAQKFSKEHRTGLHIDRRYDNFWASLLDKNKEFPSELRIVSWNYDTQLELSISSFMGSNLELSYDKLNMISTYNNFDGFQTDKFAIFKLNGSAKMRELLESKSSYLATDLGNGDHFKFFQDILSSYRCLQNSGRDNVDQKRYTCELSFAWEHDDFASPYYSKLKESVANTEYLVVIGYSFPFFNRRVDKQLINEYMPELKKVYFQGKEPQDLKERFLAINNKISDDNLMLRYDLDQFTFPNELSI